MLFFPGSVSLPGQLLDKSYLPGQILDKSCCSDYVLCCCLSSLACFRFISLQFAKRCFKSTSFDLDMDKKTDEHMLYASYVAGKAKQFRRTHNYYPYCRIATSQKAQICLDNYAID